MKIYVGHSTAFDYINELYLPLKSCVLSKKYELVFPHDKQSEIINTQKIIMDCDLFIAEVSYPSTGLGIELGWASNSKCSILCIAKEWVTPSTSIKIICSDIITYSSTDMLINDICKWINMNECKLNV